MKKFFTSVFALVMLVTLSACTKQVEDEVISVNVNGKTVEGEFTGTLEDKAPVGQGIFKVRIDNTSSWVYTGDFANNSLSGLGTVEGYPFTLSFDGIDIDGVYTGTMDNGAISGAGSFMDTEDGVTFEYTGDWQDGKLTGEGKLKYDKYVVHFSDVDREGAYDGDVVDAVACGEGTFTAINDYGNTYTYTGGWKDGLWDGYGEQIFEGSDYSSNIGTFTRGVFTPTADEFILSLGTNPALEFPVNECSIDFIREHPDFFTASDPAVLDSFVDWELNYKQMVKTPDRFGDKLMKLDNYIVLQIWEYDLWGKTVTEMLIHDEAYEVYYYVFYLNSAPNVYDGSTISLYALPVYSSSYETTVGGVNNCYVLFGCYVG